MALRKQLTAIKEATHSRLTARFPIRFQLLGYRLGKMAKNSMEITKSIFLRQNSGNAWAGDKSISGVVGGNPPGNCTVMF